MWSALPELDERRRRVVLRGGSEGVSLTKIQGAELDLADANRVRQHSLENRLQLAGRGTDDLQHFGRCRLLLEGFLEIARPGLHLVEQARVLDGDHGLVGEGLGQRDLLFGKRKNLGATENKRPDNFLLTHQGHSENRSVAHPSRHLASDRELASFGLQIVDMNGLAIDYRASVDPVPRYPRPVEVHRDWTVVGADTQEFSLSHQKSGVVCAAHATCRFRQRVEYLLQIESRATDDLQHIGGRGLLLQRFGEIVGALA